MTTDNTISFDEAMHTECDWCGEMAMNHRLTDSGNFYCLIPHGNPYMARAIKSQGPAKQRVWASTRAKSTS